jgi:DNA/RNA-binding domain of Phe-tRNA-synthetase-like protein
MTSPLHVSNALPPTNPAGGIRLGLVRAEGVRADHYPEGFEDALGALLAGGPAALPDAEVRRTAARDMLRNGRYKPTGRGKPASEYLARAAAEGTFPRINALVDINNLLSLETGLPISLWDLDRAEAEGVRFRLGREGEAYVFNAAGQTLDVLDLAVGCRQLDGGAGGPGSDEPFVSPIKDSEATKTTGDTRRVAACVYAPLDAVSPEALAAHCAAFARWLAGCGEAVQTATAVLEPGGTARL